MKRGLLKWTLGAVGAIAAAIFAAAPFFYTVEKDRAVFQINRFGDSSFPLVANQRTFLVVTIKNTGRNYGIIEAAAVGPVDELPAEPTYDPVDTARVQIEGRSEQAIYSDLGVKPMIFTQPEINALSKGSVPLKIAGFIEYSDKYWFGKRIVGFCYVWDHAINGGDFTPCTEHNYTYSRWYFFSPGIQ